MTTSHVPLPSRVPKDNARVERSLGRLHHAGGDRHAWADDRAAEDDQMRLVAALLVLGSLLVWILFLQG